MLTCKTELLLFSGIHKSHLEVAEHVAIATQKMALEIGMLTIADNYGQHCAACPST